VEWTPIAISIGAVLGALSRYYLTLLWVRYRGIAFPYGTLFVNVTGALMIGFWVTWSTQQGFISLPLQRLVLVGFLGAYTTFSSYILDTANLFNAKQKALGNLYWLGSPVLGLLGIEAGIWLAGVLG
jgi:CrcB protein